MEAHTELVVAIVVEVAWRYTKCCKRIEDNKWMVLHAQLNGWLAAWLDRWIVGWMDVSIDMAGGSMVNIIRNFMQILLLYPAITASVEVEDEMEWKKKFSSNHY